MTALRSVLPTFSALGKASADAGLSNLKFCKVSTNTSAELTGEAPVAFDGVNELDFQASTNKWTISGDNKVFESGEDLKEVTGTLTVPNTTPEFEEHVLGYTRVGAGLQTAQSAGPEFILKYERVKANGDVVFHVTGCTRFTPILPKGKTRGDSPETKQLSVSVAAPSNGSLGNVGNMTFDTSDAKWKELGYTVEEFRTKFYAEFGWDIQKKVV